MAFPLLSPQALSIFVLGSITDIRSTWLCWTTPGLHEANPVTTALSAHIGLIPTLVGVKVAAALATLALCAYLGARFPTRIYAPRLAAIILVSLGCIFAVVGAHNFVLLAHGV